MVRRVTAWTTEMWDEWQRYIDQSEFESAAARLLMEEVQEHYESMSASDRRSYKRRIKRHLRNANKYNRQAGRMNKRYERWMGHENPRHARR